MQNNVAIFHKFNIFSSFESFSNKTWLELSSVLNEKVSSFLYEKVLRGNGTFSEVGWPDNVMLLRPCVLINLVLDLKKKNLQARLNYVL